MRKDLIKRYTALPDEIQKLIAEDMETAFENRITVQERVLAK